MEIAPVDATAELDRLATMDEIQAALTISSDVFVPRETEDPWEVPSDRGGYVLISTEIEDASILTSFEKVDTMLN